MRSPVTSLIRIHLLVALVGLTLAGCPDDSASGGPVETCESIGQQCKLGGGQLGVCTMTTDGETRCEPQH